MTKASKGKHTGGEWEVGPDGRTILCYDGTHAAILICDCNNDCTTDREAEANARLIARCPEMEEMLSNLYFSALEAGRGNTYMDWGKIAEGIKELVQKARGE